MQNTYRLAKAYAGVPRPVLLTGPTGSGKGHLAALIHAWSGAKGSLVSVTGGQLSDSLAQSQLFGHVRGAFTDAKERSRGAFELAQGGTLFLDELPLWSHAVQSALLRPLAEGLVRPLGAERELPVTSKIVFATTRSIDELVTEGTLLADLRWRVPFFEVRVPALVERRADILPLAEQFLRAASAEFAFSSVERLGSSAVSALLTHSWPGNVRELRHSIEFAVVQAGEEKADTIESRHLPSSIAMVAFDPRELDPPTLRAVVDWGLRHGEGHAGTAAKLLGVHRNTISRWRTRPHPTAPEFSTPNDARPGTEA